jgi:hypothetical protein
VLGSARGNTKNTRHQTASRSIENIDPKPQINR